MGENTVVNLSEITSKYVGAPFKIGGRSRDDGFDCFSLAFTLARDLGKDPPAILGDLNLENYADLYARDPDAAVDALVKYAETYLEEVPPARAFVGDLLILRRGGGRRFAALHAGNDFIISAFENVGVSIAKLRTFKVEKVFKWATNY